VKKNYLKTLIFEIKHFRNNWAHQQKFDLRDCYRIVDTLLYLVDIIQLDPNSEYFKLLKFFRNGILEELVKMI
jgi:hypothetical protein